MANATHLRDRSLPRRPRLNGEPLNLVVIRSTRRTARSSSARCRRSSPPANRAGGVSAFDREQWRYDARKNPLRAGRFRRKARIRRIRRLQASPASAAHGLDRIGRGAWQSKTSRPYEILMRCRTNPNGSFTRLGARRPVGKEVFMLDVAFVVLGLAVLALMGVYAVGLRQL